MTVAEDSSTSAKYSLDLLEVQCVRWHKGVAESVEN